MKKFKFMTGDTMKKDLESLEILIVKATHALNKTHNERCNRGIEEFLKKYDA